MTRTYANRIWIAAAAIACAALLAAAPAASAATTYTPTTTSDPTPVANACTPSAPPNTPCSLREAIIAANSDPSPPANVSIPSGHYTLTDTSGATPIELEVTQSMTITGAGPRTTVIDGGGASAPTHGRDFNVEGANTDVTIQGVTVTGGVAPSVGSPSGDAGGILDNTGRNGELTLRSDSITGNRATFSGGGVDAPIDGAPPAVVIDRTTVSDNVVSNPAPNNGLGAGIDAGNSLTVTNSTIANNHITTVGQDEGAGIAQMEQPLPPSAAVTLSNDTITGNTIAGSTSGSLGGAGISGDNLGPSTVATTLGANNTIVADNTVNGAQDNCAAVQTERSDHNLSTDSSCAFTDSGSKQNTEPALGPLQNNGGDTDTEAELAQSPAINAGDNAACPTIDQRGVFRPQAGICDIGAFELVFQADLAITATQAPKPVGAGEKVTYKLKVTNHGPEPAAGVAVKVKLPHGLKLRSKFRRCSGKPLTCHLSDLGAGASTTFKLVASAKKIGRYHVKATVSGTYADPKPKNNTVKLTTRVARPGADLAITDRASPTSASAGRPVSFDAVVKNRGPQTATGVTATDQLPSGLEFVSVHAAHGHCSGGAAVHCSLGTLRKGSTATFTVVAKGRAAGTYTNHVSVKSRRHDPHQRNNRASSTVTIGGGANCQGGQLQHHGAGQTNVCQRNGAH